VAESIKDRLATSGVLNNIILPSAIDQTLSALELSGPVDVRPDGITLGAVAVTHDLSKSPVPGFDFALALPEPGITVPFKLKLDPVVGPTSFRFWLQLADETHAFVVFKFVDGVPGFALTGATKTVRPDGSVSLDALGAADPKSTPMLVSRSAEAGAALGPCLLISGTDGTQASMRFTPDNDSTDGVIAFGLEPSTVVFGKSNIGFDLPSVIIDDSETAKGPGAGAPRLDPPKPSIDADVPAWRGILARELDFYLPADVPLFGGQPIKGYLAIPRGQGGVELVVESAVPDRPATATIPGRPGYKVRIECLDPTASGLSGLVPTLISASMELPLDGAKAGFTTQGGAAEGITFGAGKPIVATATLSRDPVNAPGEFKVVVGVAGQGQDGLLSVSASAMGGPKIFNTSAALATALIADKDVAHDTQVGDTAGVVLAALLAAGAVLSSLFSGDSKFVLHGAEIESSGHGAPIGGKLVLSLDYSVAVIVTEVDVGVLSVSMNPNQPMRIRIRHARMSLDFTKSGLDMIGLDFERASMEVENPGAWNVGGLESLFDVLRSRSGRGSSWIEVDLGFKLNLGPIMVSGATIRATLTDSGGVEASIRGLVAGIDIPGAISGTGSLRLLSNPDGFAADLTASLIPLNLSIDAGVLYAPPMVLLRLSVDLPAPIPLANTGFGLIGIGGLVGFSARPDYASTGEADPIAQQLHWDPRDAGSFMGAPGQTSFGLSAAVGTLPDLGFTFSARAGILITAPDLAIRGSLNGKVLQPAVKMTDPSWPPPPGISFVGFVSVDSTALDFGLFGEVNLLPLLEVKVPLAGKFPFSGDTSDWYVYLGADGAAVEGRSIGPISAKVLPDIIGAEADAYFMVRGHGITDWPNGHRLLSVSDGLIVAFGFSIQSTFGVKPIVWAELYASLDLLVGSKPPTLAGFGQAGGSLNLGPFSLGVQAQVKFIVADAIQYFWAEVTGRIELFFFDIEGTVTISFGDNAPALKLPQPDRHPLDRVEKSGARLGSLATLTDDRYRIVGELVEDPAQAKTVWPDTIVSLPFAVAPAINGASAGAQFPAVVGPGATPPPARLGTEMLHYNWQLETVTLTDVTDEPDKVNGPGTIPAGQFASRWQVPRGGPGESDVNELLLFSTGPDLWVNRLADGGASLPGGDPLKAAADICGDNVPDPGRGWAVGFLAAQDSGGFRLPPDPVSANPRVSRVGARMHHYGLVHRLVIAGAGIFEVLLDNVHALPEPYTLDRASLVAWPKPDSIERTFEGHLVAPDLCWLAGESLVVLQESDSFLAQAIGLELDEAMTAGELILVFNKELIGTLNRINFARVAVVDDKGHAWTSVRSQPLPTGEDAFIYAAPTADPISILTVSYPLGVSLGVVGIGGITVSAMAAVQAERTQIAAEAARLAAAAAAGPPTDPSVIAPHARAILDPGRLYRIEIDMTWAGQIAQQNEQGQVEVVTPATVNFGDPASHVYAGAVSTKKQLFFRTAPKVMTAPPAVGSTPFLVWLMGEQDVFQPEMLERYLGGYEPAQSEEYRFCDDPLRAHFTQDHVPALAAAYGFDIKVAVRRVDRPGPQYAAPILMEVLWTFATNPRFLGAVDRIRYENALASACDVPKPGSTATVPLPALEPLAWYDVYIKAKAQDAGFSDGILPGVTFRTSRWRDPTDMFAGLGFTIAGHAPAAVVSGDLAIAYPSTLAPSLVLDDDQAFQNALVTLGLEGWPATDEPRLSRLWVPDASGTWLFAGLLIESPEPINRPGRLDLGALTAQMGGTGPLVFDIGRRDRSGGRLLLLTSAPFRVLTVERVGLLGRPPFFEPVALPVEGDPFGLGHGPLGPRTRPVVAVLTLKASSTVDGAVTPVAGTLVIPAQPSFAGDP
jgi:hypothetical protein